MFQVRSLVGQLNKPIIVEVKKINNNNWTIIYSSDHKGHFLHEKHLRKSNPYAQILKLDFTNNIPKEVIHREPDRIVRPWLQKNHHLIKHNNVALVEYDVLITKQLPDINLCNVFIGKHDPPWAQNLKPIEWLQNMSYKLGKIKQDACIVAIFCFYLMSKNCIDIIVDKKYDYLYEDGCDLLCEIRFPSILKNGGVVIAHDANGIMNNIKWLPKEKDLYFNKNVPGFYHPVKNAVI